MRLIPWEAEAKGHYDEAIRSTGGEDFGDNRVPGKGQKKVQEELDHGTGIRQPELDNQLAVIGTHFTGIILAQGQARFAP